MQGEIVDLKDIAIDLLLQRLVTPYSKCSLSLKVEPAVESISGLFITKDMSCHSKQKVPTRCQESSRVTWSLSLTFGNGG